MRGLLDKSRKCAGGKTNENFCAGNAFPAQTKLYSLADSNEENYFEVADDPDCSETKSDSFSVFPTIFVPNESYKTTLESELRDTFVPESTPTCSTESSNAPSPSCQLPCCTQNRIYHPTVDELKKTPVRQTSSVGKQRQCPASNFLKYP